MNIWGTPFIPAIDDPEDLQDVSMLALRSSLATVRVSTVYFIA
jgi:hypothetical protein